ncbi:lipoyl(octanoyl) transferase [candidate division GN15 bacterium]|uniref:Octanoyltransferase n=1 Tax=candidate division GN15 bacterium TaxID=2072418 RepID=A0A855X7Q5_9BACT|nr:MAG: lipoyl(octanoyl) transferase [candidate division GN15 bacterium]
MTRSGCEHYGWVLDVGRQEYGRTLAWQHSLVTMRQQGLARDTIMLVEHPPVITVGKNGHSENFENAEIEPQFIERGGDVTYHGPGQLVAYFVFNLTRRGRDIKLFMDRIQEGIIRTLASYNVEGKRGEEYTGVWVGEKKVASIGVAVRQWITFHGTAINLNTELTEFNGINPCGLDAKVMTSLEKLTGRAVDMKDFGNRLIEHYTAVFETEFAPVDLESLAEALESQAGGYGV